MNMNLYNDNKDVASMRCLTPNSRNNRCRAGFTLTELLIVIVIIAILAAIIYPVFSSVMENNRQATSISNMHDISAKLAEFELDNHAPPLVLFGFVVPPTGGGTVPTTMENAFATAEQAGTTAKYFPGLYPTYINSVAEFTDPNNPIGPSDTPSGNVPATTNNANTNVLAISGALVQSSPQGPGFYNADAYDSSPNVTGSNSLGATWVTRYQEAWTDVTSTGISPLPSDPAGVMYQQQLHWQFPPADTYVTCTTYHVPKANVVLILFQDGSVRKFPTKNFLGFNNGTDPTDIGTGITTDPGSPQGISPANFWQITSNTSSSGE